MNGLSPGLCYLQRRLYHCSRLRRLKYITSEFTAHLGAIQTKQIVAWLKQISIQVPDKWSQTWVHVWRVSVGATGSGCNLCPTHLARGERDRGWWDTQHPNNSSAVLAIPLGIPEHPDFIPRGRNCVGWEEGWWLPGWQRIFQTGGGQERTGQG